MSHRVFGIRHHGPGCARALRTALEEWSPDAVLIEGPPDAEEALQYVADEGMKPPIALLVHAVDDPQNGVFYPFAEFSPEWQALRFAAERGVPARFMDLPCAITLAMKKEEKAKLETPKAEVTPEGPIEADQNPGAKDHAEAPGEPQSSKEESDSEQSDEADQDSLREDPIGVLAEAAGFSDHEQWWDTQVEQRRDAGGLFEGILEAMTALREDQKTMRLREEQREAHMRTVIRAAQKEGHERIAVVCGAWHSPRLATLGPAKRDAEILKGLPKIKVAATWIPWTHSRLSFRSGYGAGVDSPGWYAHLWKHGERAPVVWATLAARLLRDEDLDASAANVIETVRLASALASMRELPSPGLAELREAIEAVLCGGEAARTSLIRAKLEIGEALGEVPEQAGQVPIARDFEREARRLKLKVQAEALAVRLDLRKDNDRDKSRLIHRLNILGVGWGKPMPIGRGEGTFWESWQLTWRPELAIDLIAANVHGNTVESAAARALGERARDADLAELTKMVEVAIAAFLPAALDALLVELDARAASSSDVRIQMEALGPLARIVRYSDVRATRAEHVLPVLRGLFERVVVGVVPASTQLDDDAAAQMIGAIDHAHAACLLLDDAELKKDWLEALRTLMEREAVHARLRGRSTRLLLEQKALVEGELARRASLALSRSVEPAQSAQWIEGLVAGEGLMLVHQEELLGTLDGWLSALSEEAFQAELPLLRRAFSSLAAPERRAVAQKVKHVSVPGAAPARKAANSEPLDGKRASYVVPALARLLGVDRG